ncbi:MAG TPA: hypothetical protein VHW60_22600 [Caulobacteraceae bacterium]|jgi:hypothetical protein|nr:hypothetical protein [Caulobacteraceae bacterium]
MNDAVTPEDLAAVDIEEVQAIEDRLPMVMTVGFTGHRQIDDMDAGHALLEQAVAAVGEAFDLLITAPLAQAYDGAPRLRLMIGEAPGTDRLMANVWRVEDLGEIHTMFPFKAPSGPAAYTDRPEKGDPDTRVEPPPEFSPWTGIDADGLGLEHEQAHGEVGRWIVRHSDLLIGWWDGQPSRGAGGVNDTMQRALERGVPVIWLQPGETRLRLIDPHASRRRHADASEAMLGLDEIAGPLTARLLADLLTPSFAAPGVPGAHDPEIAARLDYAAVDPLRLRRPPLGWVQNLFNHTLWRSFRLFEHAAGGVPPGHWDTVAPPEGLIEQPGFARLRAASAEAGARANQLSSIHRSEQLLLVVIAILAVLTGAMPQVLVNLLSEYQSKGNAEGATLSSISQLVHVAAAAIEFALGFLALTIFLGARRAHRHRRWSDARRLAERLRGACGTWPLGIDVADHHIDPPQTWTEWRARAVLRAAGPRRGWIDKPRFESTTAWVTGQLIDGQILYHDRQHKVAHNVERHIRTAENWSFGILMLMLAFFVGAYLVQGITHMLTPAWFSGLVTLVSAVSPAIGAGCLALDATNGFGEISLHSARLKVEFEHRKAELGQGAGVEYHHVQAVIRSAAQLLRDENDAWRDSLLRRRIVRG